MMVATVAERDEDEAFVSLYRDRYEPMVRLAYLMVGSRAIAEELVQSHRMILRTKSIVCSMTMCLS